jgi:uncharacterized membrane protein YqaE (UPF0057 family)
MTKFILTSVLISFLLGACTIQKRVYRNGYHIEWHIAKNVKPSKQVSDEVGFSLGQKQESSAQLKKDETFTISIEEEPIAISSLEQVNVELPKKSLILNEKPLGKNALKSNARKEVIQQHFVKESSSKAAHASVSMNNTKAQRFIHALKKTTDTSSDDFPMLLIYLLCFFLPPIAVGLITDWDTEMVITNLLWTLLCGIPGIIHAIIIVGRYR